MEAEIPQRPLDVASASLSDEIIDEAFNVSVKGLRSGRWRGEIYGDLRSKGLSEAQATEILDEAQKQVDAEKCNKANIISCVISTVVTFIVFFTATILVGDNSTAADIGTKLLGGIIWLATHELGYSGVRNGILAGYVIYFIVVVSFIV